jgi:type III pantothenate kinase
MVTADTENKFKVIATGGLADILASDTKIFDAVDQHLLLKGLRLIYQMNQPSDNIKT